GFNPLPARRPGETTAATIDPAVGVAVSIRSRPEDREKPAARGRPSPTRDVSIRSRPEDREKPVSPAITVANGCFNPLPARRPGETSWPSGDAPSRVVSIRSRPEDREKRPGKTAFKAPR